MQLTRLEQERYVPLDALHLLVGKIPPPDLALALHVLPDLHEGGEHLVHPLDECCTFKTQPLGILALPLSEKT